MALLQFFLIPIVILIAGVALFVRGQRRGLGLGFAFFIAATGVGFWSIMQSRSSTAGIGVLFLPFIGVLAGVLAWGFRHLQTARRGVVRLLAWLCLTAASGLILWEAYEGVKTIQLNQTRDAAQKARTQRIDANRKAIDLLLAQNKGNESATIEALIREKSADDEYLLPALASEFVSADTLDRVARADDFGVTLTALRNPNCRPDTLARIYRTHSYPAYFHQTLAAHANTPPEILRELFAKPRQITGLDLWFAKNPATPADLLQALTDTSDINVIQGLVQNPNLDCRLLGRVGEALKRSSRPDDSHVTARLAELKQAPCRP